jgi:hypothetical protein
LEDLSGRRHPRLGADRPKQSEGLWRGAPNGLVMFDEIVPGGLADIDEDDFLRRSW